MAFDFPSSPVVGQQFTPVAGTTFTYNGYGWAISGSNGVSNSGTPIPNDIAQWVTSTTIKGTPLATLRTDAIFTGKTRVKGIIDGSEAVAGDVGEYLEITGVPNSGGGNWGPLGNGTWYSGNNLTLPPGDWDLSAHLYGTGGAGAWYYFGLSNGNTGSPDTGSLWIIAGYATSQGDVWLHMGPVRFKNTVSSTIYWYIYSGTNAYYVSAVRLRARRMR
jgi:hypothetical protein